jgi:cytosine/adenosine deaminase-related metal-dependent hydrolase
VSPATSQILRARIVVPVSRPPIENGAVLISGDRIRAVGAWNDLARWPMARVCDLGEVALLPGLVNAHCHLDYTDLAGQIAPPRSFTDWLKCLVELKRGWGYSDFAQSWLNGARMLVRTGTTTVGDIEAMPVLLPEVWEATPLRVISFIEMLGVRRHHSPADLLAQAAAVVARLPAGRNRAALSPHAPYSTTPELLRLAAVMARDHGWLLSTHVAESSEEYTMFKAAAGPMFEWLAQGGRDMSDCGGVSPVQQLERSGLLSENLVAIHLNQLDPGDAELLARRGVSVVHCPRSHDYFAHRSFPLPGLVRAGVNLCLGTDSLVTTRRLAGQPLQLDLFAEMRALHSAWVSAAPRRVLRLVTVNAARALGLTGQVGEITAGAFADLITVPFGGPVRQVYDAVTHRAGPVSASMMGGKWVGPPGDEPKSGARL